VDIPTMAKFLLELLSVAALVFASFFGAYLAASYVVLSSPHGTEAAWETMKERLYISLSRSHVQISTSPALAIIRGTIEEDSQRHLHDFLVWINEISRIERRLCILRMRLRFAAVSAVVAVVSGVILAGPVLFGLPPLADKIRFFSTLVPAACAVGFYFVFNQRHAVTWAEINNEIHRIEKKFEGVVFQ
jgi:hypothetical protein